MKKAFAFLCLFFFLLPLGTSFANTRDPLNVYFFYGAGCPHCANERAYLKVVEEKYPELNIQSYEVYFNTDNIRLMQMVGQVLNADIGGVPFLVIGDTYFMGYSDGISPQAIEKRIQECLRESCPDSVAKIVDNEPAEQNSTVQNASNQEPKEDATDTQNQNKEDKKIITLPILGSINVLEFSLPLLTVGMGVLDGFNPCAMWVLLFLISLLVGLKDRKRMWIFGTTFIVASASVYFLFMAAWLNLILFLGFVIWIRTLVGIVAIASGAYSIKGFLLNKNTGCEVANNGTRQKIFQNLKSMIEKNSFWLAIGGIITLAFMVNLVELICSAGFPAVYTQVLALNELATWQYYFYILLYIFFFMLDDLFVFFVAMITLEMTGITTKYSRYSRLIGGILMLCVGFLLLFKPEWLMFG